MVDCNMQSGRELFVVFAAQGGRGESGSIHPRAPRHRRQSRRWVPPAAPCSESQANEEIPPSFNPLSPVLGL